MPALLALEADHDWLTVTPVVRSDVGEAPGAERGPVEGVALRGDRWRDRDIYVCGSDEMVQAALDRLRAVGCPEDRVHYEGFQGLGGDVFGVLENRERGDAQQ
jgi:ferredoxin-NADP reductase